MKEINPRPLKLSLKQPDQKPEIRLPILSDPFISIDIDFIWEESKIYKFELFEFYLNVKEKVNY